MIRTFQIPIVLALETYWKASHGRAISGLFHSECKLILYLLTMYNVCIMCLSCNAKKSAKLSEEQKQSSFLSLSMVSSMMSAFEMLRFFMMALHASGTCTRKAWLDSWLNSTQSHSIAWFDKVKLAVHHVLLMEI